MTRRTLLSAVPALPLLHAQQPAIPDTPAGFVLRRWLEAMNSGVPEKIGAYVKVYEPQGGPEHVKMLAGMAEKFGGFDLTGIESSQPTRIVSLLRSKKEQRGLRFLLEVEAGNPPTVAGANIEPLESGPPKPKPQRLSFEDAVKATAEFAAAETAADRFSGALLIARDGQVSFERAWGLADRESKTPNTANTKFRIGSMNKMFTAAATLQLVQKGKLALADPIAKHLPDYPNRELASQVTVRHLLTHTGGTGDIFGPEFDKQRLQLRELGDYVKLYGARPLKYKPGERWAYSNYGFLLLGVLIERASGMSYYDYVRRHLFAPAGMNSTDSLPENESVPGRSKGYVNEKDAWVDNRDTLPWRGTSAGGGYSTTGDLFRFALGLHSGKILDRSLVDQAMSKQESLPRPGLGYGYGFMVDEREPGLVGHGGGAPGMNGELLICRRNGVVIAALSNFDPPAATNVARFFTDRMPL